MPPSRDMEAFQHTLRNSKHIIAVAGAGLSAASGIPTFRGSGGMWRKYEATSLATPEAFYENPSRVWQFYHYRREKALQAQPNAAHIALSQFSLASIRHRVAPESTFTLITQNVDGLSERSWVNFVATQPDPAAIDDNNKQPRILEMHGRVHDVLCTSKSCGHIENNTSSPISPALRGTEDQVDAGIIEPNIPLSDLPKCSKCGELARPGVVWFGERPQYMDTIDDLVEEADLCLVVGTSSVVYPAAAYSAEVAAHGGKVAVFNLDRSARDEDADYLFLGPCEELLPRCLGLEGTV